MSRMLNTTKGTITIRVAATDDASAVRELRLEALASKPVAFSADYALSAAQSAGDWADRIRIFEAEKAGAICIALSDEGPVGMAGLALGHWLKIRHNGNIWGVYVRLGWRGLHISEALLQECIDWGKDHGVAIFKLGVATTNSSAIRCYTRAGFRTYGVDPQAVCVDGAYYDELLMAKPA